MAIKNIYNLKSHRLKKFAYDLLLFQHFRCSLSTSGVRDSDTDSLACHHTASLFKTHGGYCHNEWCYVWRSVIMNKLSLNKLQHQRLSRICVFFHSLRVLLKAHEAGVNLIGEDSFTHMSEPLIALKWRVCRVFNENDPGYLSVLIREEKVSKVRGTEHVGNQLCLFLIYAHHSAACPSATNVTRGKLPTVQTV